MGQVWLFQGLIVQNKVILEPLALCINYIFVLFSQEEEPSCTECD